MENMKNSDYLSEGYVVKVDIREIVNLPEWQELRGYQLKYILGLCKVY